MRACTSPSHSARATVATCSASAVGGIRPAAMSLATAFLNASFGPNWMFVSRFWRTAVIESSPQRI